MSDSGEKQKLSSIVANSHRLQYGEAFLEMVHTEGWKAFLLLLNRHRQEIGSASLDDSPKMHQYWRGRRDEVDALLGEVESLAGEVEELGSVEPEAVTAFMGQRVGAGDSDEDDD